VSVPSTRIEAMDAAMAAIPAFEAKCKVLLDENAAKFLE
jgi:hypothetical protein